MPETCKDACGKYRATGFGRAKPFCNGKRGRPLLIDGALIDSVLLGSCPYLERKPAAKSVPSSIRS